MENGWKHWKNAELCLGLHYMRVNAVTLQTLRWSKSSKRFGNQNLGDVHSAVQSLEFNLPEAHGSDSIVL